MAGLIPPLARFSRVLGPQPDNTLIGLWPASAMRGTIVGDASGDNNPLASLSVSVVPTPYGLALSGTAATANATNPAFLTPSITYAAWVNVTSFAANRTIFGGVSPFPILFVNTSGFPTFTKNGAGNLAASSVALVAGQWAHVVGTYDSASHTWFVYVNGRQAGTSTTAETWATTGAMGIGVVFVFAGQLADVRAYQRAISAAEVYALYAGAFQPNDIEPMALFSSSGGPRSFPIFGAPSSSATRAPGETVSVFV